MSLTRRAGLVFLCAFGYLGWISASRFVLALSDEGIYLDGGLRILHGQMPYKDFFALTGPGTFALIAASLRVFGTTLAAARVPVLWDLAIMTACVFWLGSHLSKALSNQLTAVFAAFTFLAFVTLGETAVVANHRWDSSAWAVLAVTLLIGAPESKRASAISFAAGVAVGIAAWCTPPVALVAVALGICLVAYREMRDLFVPYAGGVALALAAGISWIISNGALWAMIDSFRWSATNYSGPNRTWYGAVMGGYTNLIRGTSFLDTASTIALLLFLTLPATLPFFSALWLWRRPPMSVVILLATGAALILSTYPRWDLFHLTWVSAPFYALAAPLVASSALKKPVALIVLIGAASCCMVNIEERIHETTRATSIGAVHGKQGDVDVLEAVQAHVQPSDTIFAFPMRPMLYFVTGAHNPTRYSFLQPGMFSDRDESEALSELRAHPPRWVFYTNVPTELYLRIWPGSDPTRLRMNGIEDFLKENYREKDQWADFHLLEGRSVTFAVR
jgi:4-amino-4-deoxy-L-arabinose transferase-like glycosyltransferase